MPAPFRALISAVWSFLFLVIATSAAGDETADSPSPILEWRFDGVAAPGTWFGDAVSVQDKVSGPRPPRYPGFDEGNRAGYFPGGNAGILVRDHETGGTADVRFRSGDSFTFEAWIKPKSIKKGTISYLVGKGRHPKHGQGLGEMNQNYAVRIQGGEDGHQLGLLFTSRDPDSDERNWHRWWSTNTVPVTGWHHVALVYTFGEGDSIRAYIDGKPSGGAWDLGGQTDRPPVNDADDLVLGTGYTRAESSSFIGWMDNVAIYRAALPAAHFTDVYAYQPPPPQISEEMVPAGKVLMQISERDVPAANRWPDEPQVTESYQEEAFGFVDWPQKYISTGVRGDRANPSHVRASAHVMLPKGTHRFLLRGRGAARLFIDGRQILETPFPGDDPGGFAELSLQDDYLDLGPDFRFAPPGNRENWTEFTSDGGKHFVILETMIGGKVEGRPRRPEFGETVVAWSPAGSESWQLLSPGQRRVAYTDAGWAAYEAERRAWLARVDAAAREERRRATADYWNARREAAKQWLASTEPVPVPELRDGYPAHNAIDHFIGARIASAADAQTATVSSIDYFEQVKPLLESRCYDCHAGKQVQGALRIDRAADAHHGGDSGPAVIPGDAQNSLLIDRITDRSGAGIMPPQGDPLSAEEVALLTRWIEEGASWPEFDVDRFELTPLTDDLPFLRRLALDTVGVPPSEEEIARFLDDDSPTRRQQAIDRYLDDPRWADRWMGYWQDVLAENPNLLNPSLNSTGPFRWWLYESLLDNKPADLFATELIRMEGSERFGGPAGFGTAFDNDVPMAAKGIIVSSAFLGVQMKCARCHDAPAHVSKQQDLFELAAMLKESSIKLPTTSSVPMDKIHRGGRKPLIEVTLEPGSRVEPNWPFARFCDETAAMDLARDPEDSRDRLATLITAPQNERFAQVMVNRLWQKLMGRGIVETVSDWEKSEPTHPALLRWLGRELVASGYDMQAAARLILNSHAYQRGTDRTLHETGPLYIAPAPRRLDAEQIVDSLFSATGAPFDLEEVCLDIDSSRNEQNGMTLGQPRRAWMLASTTNDRDRPSLSLPRIQAVNSVLEIFGWRSSRQDPTSIRETDPTVLQPAIVANGTMGVWLTRLGEEHDVTALALEEQSLETLVDRLFLRLLTRKPSAAERDRYVALLQPGYQDRIVPESERRPRHPEGPRRRERYVSWSNHTVGPANRLAKEKEQQARAGAAPTTALREAWRLRLEDALWALLNSPEWIYAP